VNKTGFIMGLGMGQLLGKRNDPEASVQENYKEANSTPSSLPNLVLMG
jgi:hypothetical protein